MPVISKSAARRPPKKARREPGSYRLLPHVTSVAIIGAGAGGAALLSILGRDPEAAGLNSWVPLLVGALDAVPRLFIRSPEFQVLGPDCHDADALRAFVTRLYEKALGRTPGIGELNLWVSPVEYMTSRIRRSIELGHARRIGHHVPTDQHVAGDDGLAIGQARNDLQHIAPGDEGRFDAAEAPPVDRRAYGDECFAVGSGIRIL